MKRKEEESEAIRKKCKKKMAQLTKFYKNSRLDPFEQERRIARDMLSHKRSKGWKE